MNDVGPDTDEHGHETNERVPQIELPGRELYDSGQVTIPAREREYYGIEHNDAVDVYVATETVAFAVPAVMVHHDGAIRIPHRLRSLYDLDDGDTVDIGIHPTGRKFER